MRGRWPKSSFSRPCSPPLPLPSGIASAASWRTILASRREAGFRLRPLAPRLRALFFEVLCQAKVIRERPLAGLAHAFVFWGFCAFSLVTLNHIGLGFGVPFLALGSRWFPVAAVFALLVAVSITGLTVRRFLVRPKWLGDHVSMESGLIALLIFLLMATYLADYALAPAGLPARALWWTHTLSLLIFLPLLPHTKHLHLLLSPLTVFLASGRFGSIPPLEGDDDFGLDTGKDITRMLALEAYSCVECGRCQQHCPAQATGKSLNPKQIALGLRAYLNAHGSAAEAPLLGAHLSETDVFQCTTCGACQAQCPVGVEHLPLIVGLRRGAVNTGRWADEHGAELFHKLERNGNPLGFSSLERDRFLRKNALPLFDGTEDYCLWLGCMGSYDPRGREIVLALVKLLGHLGITFGVLKKEKCTGDAARRLGNDLAFRQLAEFNIAQMRAAGVKKLLSICPHCVRTIGHDWRELGAEFEIEHHAVFLARHRQALPPAAKVGRVVYHDPCYLGRYQGVFDEPRQLLRDSAQLVEPPHTTGRSFCCGAGGGLTFLGEEQGSRISHARSSELLATGAETVAAACPFCHSMLGDALATLAPDNAPRLLDLAEIVAARLEKEPT